MSEENPIPSMNDVRAEEICSGVSSTPKKICERYRGLALDNRIHKKMDTEPAQQEAIKEMAPALSIDEAESIRLFNYLEAYFRY